MGEFFKNSNINHEVEKYKKKCDDDIKNGIDQIEEKN